MCAGSSICTCACHSYKWSTSTCLLLAQVGMCACMHLPATSAAHSQTVHSPVMGHSHPNPNPCLTLQIWMQQVLIGLCEYSKALQFLQKMVDQRNREKWKGGWIQSIPCLIDSEFYLFMLILVFDFNASGIRPTGHMGNPTQKRNNSNITLLLTQSIALYSASMAPNLAFIQMQVKDWLGVER